MDDRETEFRDFVGAQMESLRGLAYLTCGDWQAAEDATLAVLARLYVKWNKIESPASYARAAVVRAAIDETRRPWWRREQSNSHAMPEPALPDHAGAVDERLHLRQALLHLKPRLRAVLVLRFLEGRSVQQTAEALGCPEGTVKAYTSRGLARLRELLNVELSDTWEDRHEAARAV
ncbi:sigma-70 family RNA polymerase sigma factor [Actinoplanes sp. NBRC 103695]|uniref:sigma-70 family RNA polymerase sigma factor n=1 Tax=Actinoplanes sp. NBRC 103695 TaxID=3032202 RepID=UPI0024A2FFBE|nr:sigma-70 family RNA polymerase sigma factor [Actinoplanes sp. NBRC 103695]GLY97867.1 RNA polymerase sigma24 factor [Actinoplanes sp. NBRC 103695]